jgi:hypothetical protein
LLKGLLASEILLSIKSDSSFGIYYVMTLADRH